MTGDQRWGHGLDDVSLSGRTARLADLLRRSRRTVFLGGAGVSTESGIPDFRSDSGLYRNDLDLPFPTEYVLSHDCLAEHPDVFFDFYRSHLLHPEARPNRAHLALARMEEDGRLAQVITQNIDGLHQAAGSRRVVELHGSVARNHCLDCGQPHGLEVMLTGRGVPRCQCGGTVRPDVVLFGETLDLDAIDRAVAEVRSAALLLVAGTSLNVHPAAGLVEYFRGDHLAVVNLEPTPYDRFAEVVIRAPLGQVLEDCL